MKLNLLTSIIYRFNHLRILRSFQFSSTYTLKQSLQPLSQLASPYSKLPSTVLSFPVYPFTKHFSTPDASARCVFPRRAINAATSTNNFPVQYPVSWVQFCYLDSFNKHFMLHLSINCSKVYYGTIL